MFNVILENGYFLNACRVGGFVGGIDVESLPNETDETRKKAYKLVNGQWVFDETKYQELLKEQAVIDKQIKDEDRKFEIQERLNQLSQDFVQVWCGAEIPDINTRIAEFQLLHNELRTLNGKEPRAYLHENPENTENTVDENV